MTHGMTAPSPDKYMYCIIRSSEDRILEQVEAIGDPTASDSVKRTHPGAE